MTNEEKASEIVFGWADTVQKDAYDAALNMSKWKDQQFKDKQSVLIDKAWQFIESLVKFTGLDSYDVKEEYMKTMEEL